MMDKDNNFHLYSDFSESVYDAKRINFQSNDSFSDVKSALIQVNNYYLVLSL